MFSKGIGRHGLDGDQHDQGREIDAAEIGEDLPDRPVQRLGDVIERAQEIADEVVVGVDDVEHDQPAQHHLDEDHHAEHAQQKDDGTEESGDQLRVPLRGAPDLAMASCEGNGAASAIGAARSVNTATSEAVPWPLRQVMPEKPTPGVT